MIPAAEVPAFIASGLLCAGTLIGVAYYLFVVYPRRRYY
jgi:hypothetical protein